MPLSVKFRHLGRWIALGLLLGTVQPVSALEAVLKKRQDFCTLPQKPCQPLFSLNQGEKVEVLSQGSEPEWLKIRYSRNAQIGWIPTNSVDLILPDKLQSKKIHSFTDKSHPVWIYSREGSRILAGNEIFRLDPEKAELFSEGKLRFLNSHADMISPCFGDPSALQCLERQELEKNSFLQVQTERKNEAFPRYETLLHLTRTDLPPQLAFSPSWVVQAPGQAFWGDSMMVLFSETFQPRQVLSSTRDLIPFVPADLRSKIRLDALEIVALENRGIVYLVAGQFARKEKLLLRFQISDTPPWKYLGQLTWPERIPWQVGKAQPRIRVASQGEDTWLALAPAAEPENFELFFFSVTGAPLLHEPVPQLRDLWLDPQNRLWILAGDSLLQKRVVFEAKSK